MYLRATSYPLSSLRFFAVCAVLLLGAVKAGYGQRVYAKVARSLFFDQTPHFSVNNTDLIFKIDDHFNQNDEGIMSISQKKLPSNLFPRLNATCPEPIGTTVEIPSISVPPLLTLPLGSITNRNYAFDNNINTASVFEALLTVAGTFSQTVNFSDLSNAGDAATVTFSVPPNPLLDLGLLNNITIATYNGNTQVSSQSLENLLSLDLLGLLRSGEKHTVSMASPPFNKIQIRLTVTLGLATKLNLWEVSRTPAKPVVPIAYPAVIEICDGETASIIAESQSPGSILRWYDALSGGNLLKESSANPDTYTSPSIPYTSPTDTTFVYVSSAWGSSCPAESERTKVAIVVRPKPTVAPITGANEVCEGKTITLTSAPAEGEDQGEWSTGDEFIATVNPLTGLVTGNSPGTVTIRYTVTDSETFCSNSQVKTVTVFPQPGKPHLTITDVYN